MRPFGPSHAPRRRRRLGVPFALWACAAPWPAPAGTLAQSADTAESAEETCIQCHRKQRDPRLRRPTDQLGGSVHGGLGCSKCHGGRPDEASARAHDVQAGFVARIAAGERPALCGGCHVGLQARGAGAGEPLPTDQLELYQTSVHGKALARGEARAATCVTCHGSHDIERARDPESPVSPPRVAATCGRCHSDAEKMRSLGLPHDQERQWRHSVHGRAFARYVKAGAAAESTPGERHPPTCNDCHDDHAVAGRDAAVSGCHGCHEAQWVSFEAGPHAKAFARMGFLPCVDCHGSHEIAPVDSSLIGVGAQASCRRCHSEGQELFAKVEALGGEVRAAEQAAERARAALSAEPVSEVARVLGPIDEARARLRELVHTLDLEAIARAAARLTALSSAVPTAAAGSDALFGVAPKTWAPALLLIALGAILLVLALRKRGPR